MKKSRRKNFGEGHMVWNCRERILGVQDQIPQRKYTFFFFLIFSLLFLKVMGICLSFVYLIFLVLHLILKLSHKVKGNIGKLTLIYTLDSL